MNILDAVILGITEGMTEFLPVSSTGHLILVSELLELPMTEFLKTFEVAIQMGAILAVLALYWKRLFLERRVIERVLLALLPALIIGALFYPIIRQFLGSQTVVAWALLTGGFILILFESFHSEATDSLDDIGRIPYRTAFFIGIFQALAVIPGVSRAGATIVGGLLLGLKRKAIVEFSFLLAVPTMVAATTLDLWKNAAAFSMNDLSLLLVGFVTSFVVALFAIRFLLHFIANHTFTSFGVYRIVVGLLMLFLLV